MTQIQEEITAEDFIKLRFPNSPALSPDGKLLVFAIKSVNEQKNTYKSALYLHTEGEDYQQFTAGTYIDTAPKFSPCGKYLAFLSSRSENGIQVFIMRISGGEAFQITNFPIGVTNFVWSHDSRLIHLIASVNKEELQEILDSKKKEKPSFILDPASFDAYQAKEKQKRNLKSDPRVINEAYCREGTKYLENRFYQPFIIPVSFPKINGDDNDEKIVHLGEWGYHYGIGIFSLDNQFIFLSKVKDDPAITLYQEILRIDITNPKEAKLLGTMFGGVINFQISPDGRYISWEGRRESVGIFDNNQIFIYDLKTNKNGFYSITEGFDRSATQSQWINNNHMLFLSTSDGRMTISDINIETRAIKAIIDEDRSINSFSVSKTGTKIAYEVSHSSFPSDIFWCDGTGSQEERITEANKEYLQTHLPAKVEAYTYERDGIKFQGWVLLPPNHNGKDKLPVILEIHGGPAVMWSPHEMTLWHEWNVLVSKGYAVVFCNPRGSDGYGIDFRGAVFKNWGDMPEKDILKALDTALDRYSFLDSKKVGVTGGSYGGYMTAWLITHTDRFKAAVSQRGVYEFIAFAMTTDIPIWFEKEYDIDLIEQYVDIWNDAPIRHIKNLNTPLLVIHSDNDYRAPVVNAEQLFWAAKRYNKIVEFVRYPRDGHELSRSGEPRHRIDRI
ncbi:MAG: S9 family peptidase, partial [Candidatus Hodarchaeota archaeon]